MPRAPCPHSHGTYPPLRGSIVYTTYLHCYAIVLTQKTACGLMYCTVRFALLVMTPSVVIAMTGEASHHAGIGETLSRL
ncbi:hypothetical protein F4777DRAFT_544663 [Nemania sp. FL0916]|nr:hypothetical protein F4777DRAFT_544663 [Nemania sp. FL0916]